MLTKHIPCDQTQSQTRAYAKLHIRQKIARTCMKPRAQLPFVIETVQFNKEHKNRKLLSNYLTQYLIIAQRHMNDSE